jgi:hypothetical protein
MGEVRRIPLPRTPVNKGKKEGRRPVGLAPSHIPWCLPDVTLLWLWVVDPKPFFCRARRYDEHYVEHRLAVAPVAHKHRVVVTFKEALARFVDSLLTVLVIESHGTRLDRSRTNPGMMVPAGRASGFDDHPYNC